MVQGYYSTAIYGERLRKCYETASARIQQYLEAEIRFVLDRLRPDSSVLEIGCGYGRVALRLAQSAGRVVGVDTSVESLELARRLSDIDSRCEFLHMDAAALTFNAQVFDVIVCIQNGICAFGVDPLVLVREALRVVRPGGRALFSTYAVGFWSERLRWFESQAAAGLMGEIDHDKTRDGTLVCRDGFRAGTFSPDAFRLLASHFSVEAVITTVDESSVFCEFVVPKAAQPLHADDAVRCCWSCRLPDGE